jgi:hypothetical protein
MPAKEQLQQISKELNKASQMHKRQSEKVAAISRKDYAKGGGVRKPDVMPKGKGMKRPTKQGAGMTEKGIKAYRAANPGSKLKGAVTGDVKKGSKAAKRRKSYCARSAGQMKKFPEAAKDPNSRLRQARKRWKC